VRILVNFMYRNGWSIHCLAEDAKTPISPLLKIAQQSTMLRLLRASGATDANMEEIEQKMARLGRGSVWIDVTDEGKKLLRLQV
jgi:hypothetical protein